MHTQPSARRSHTRMQVHALKALPCGQLHREASVGCALAGCACCCCSPYACAADVAEAEEACPAGFHLFLAQAEGLLHSVQHSTTACGHTTKAEHAHLSAQQHQCVLPTPACTELCLRLCRRQPEPIISTLQAVNPADIPLFPAVTYLCAGRCGQRRGQSQARRP